MSDYHSVKSEGESDLEEPLDSLSNYAESVDLNQFRGPPNELMKMHEQQNKESIEMIR